jgi:hypothetical protein
VDDIRNAVDDIFYVDVGISKPAFGIRNVDDDIFCVVGDISNVVDDIGNVVGGIKNTAFVIQNADDDIKNVVNHIANMEFFAGQDVSGVTNLRDIAFGRNNLQLRCFGNCRRIQRQRFLH